MLWPHSLKRTPERVDISAGLLPRHCRFGFVLDKRVNDRFDHTNRNRRLDEGHLGEMNLELFQSVV